MIKILTIIGARPQIIKSSALSRAISEEYNDRIQEVILHTGQHYDENMSRVFFEELSIPKPKYNLNVGSSSHGVQTAKMIEGIEKALIDENPNAVVVYGDTNSTLAAALAASKLLVPVIHIEAGLRSFNKTMPEEINRIMADHVSTLLFSPTLSGIKNLLNEGFSMEIHEKPNMDFPNIYHCGDIMYDNTIYFSQMINESIDKIKEFFLKYKKDFILCTIHRNANTDDPYRLNSIFKALLELAKKERIILPLHPRTKKYLKSNLHPEVYSQLSRTKKIEILPPLPFLDMIYLESTAKLVITDSGGVQKEAYFLETPCIILRPETEWVEIVENNCARLVDSDYDRIIKEANYYISKPPTNYPKIFGDARAGKFICEQIIKYI